MEDDFEDEFELMRKMLKRMFGFEEDLFDMPKRSAKGPQKYSVTIRIGSDGKPTKIYSEDYKPEEEGFLADVIPSKDGVKVIMELPGVEEKSISVRETKGGIVIEGKKTSGETVAKKISIKDINLKSMQKRYKNGILELSFKALKQ